MIVKEKRVLTTCSKAGKDYTKKELINYFGNQKFERFIFVFKEAKESWNVLKRQQITDKTFL